MTMILAALALAAAQTSPAPPADHAQHQEKGEHKAGHECCCKGEMAEGQKMECCAEHKAEHGSGNHGGHEGHEGQ